MQSELKPCAHETQCAKHTDTSRSDHPVKRMLDFATNRVETQAAEITRLTEALRAAEGQVKELRGGSNKAARRIGGIYLRGMPALPRRLCWC